MGSPRRRDSALIAAGRRLAGSPWELAVVVAFAIGSADALLYPILAPAILGSHAVVYTDAAAAWLRGGDPWAVGPPDVVFAGPPTMLLTFAPFTLVPGEVTRFAWVIGMFGAAVWALRRLRLPGYWIAFPPLFSNIILGHPEVLMLMLLVLGGRLSGLAAIIKPYAGFALLAERRWGAIAVATVVALATLLFLPWGRFIAELPQINDTLTRQDHGDSTFGSIPLMAIAVVALASLGPRRALWLATPLLWPHAQPNYKVIGVPVLPPLVAVLWAFAIPGFTLGAVVAYAVLDRIDRRRPLPAWLRAGIQPAASPHAMAVAA